MDAVDGEDAENEVVQRQDARFGKAHGLALILLAAALALAPWAAEVTRDSYRCFVLVYAIAALTWLPLVRRTLPLAKTAVIAIALRAMFLFAQPLLSGDVYRYLSDGRVSASGGNPYAYTPSDPRINHAEVRSIYPPLAQVVFRLVHTMTAWRLLLIVADIVVIVLLRGKGGLAYATCPFVIIEGTWSGHLDLLAGAVLALAMVRRSGVAAGLAAGLKIIPVTALPALARGARDRKRFFIAFALAVVLPVLPFLGGPIMPGLGVYAKSWIFNSPLYDAVRFVLEQIPTKAIWTHHPLRFELISDFVYRHLHADFLTRAILGVLAVGAIALTRRVTSAIAALLLCSPANHPWYWLTLVPSALIERSRWLYVALSMPASYLLYRGDSRLFVYGWVLVAVAAAREP
jgi:hypothetical protein